MKSAEYYAYLASREWAPHQQTHHVTYERLGHERLEDLLGVCEPCHLYLSGRSDDDPTPKTEICRLCHGRPPRSQIYLIFLYQRQRSAQTLAPLIAVLSEFEAWNFHAAPFVWAVATNRSIGVIAEAVERTISMQPELGDLYYLVPFDRHATYFSWVPSVFHEWFVP